MEIRPPTWPGFRRIRGHPWACFRPRESPAGAHCLMHSCSIGQPVSPTTRTSSGQDGPDPVDRGCGDRAYLKALRPPGRGERDTEPEVPRGPRILPRSAPVTPDEFVPIRRSHSIPENLGSAVTEQMGHRARCPRLGPQLTLSGISRGRPVLSFPGPEARHVLRMELRHDHSE